ncbi:MAG TPA: efflux RND transporter periplasmic adaptor subunit [Acetobacteraceae bacterium]|nr:efflux RND transporter periplasmic adaptor subunit [Acetobacteraceae bacterium]
MDALTRDTTELQARQRTRRWPMVLACLAVLGAIVAVIWLWHPGASKKAAHTRPEQAVPVVDAAVTQRNVPIYLDGLGTVQAFNTVTIKPMVDGPLIAVDFKEGQDVRKGDVLAQIDPRTYQAALDQALAKKAADQALLANARLDYARYQKLVANKYTSAQQADTARAQVAQDQAQIQQDDALIETARTNLGYTTIRSPIDGRTGIRQVDAGNIVHASDATGLVVITQLHPISVIFTLPQQSLGAVTAAMRKGTPTVLAYAEGANGSPANVLDTGTLSVLDNQVDPTTGTIKLKATFPNPGDRLWPGAFVGVKLLARTAENAVVVPPAAVQRGPQGTYVFQVTGSMVKLQPVTVGHEDAQQSIITQGLKPGDQVVVDGASRLSNGSKIKIVAPAPANPAAGPEPTSAPGTRPHAG